LRVNVTPCSDRFLQQRRGKDIGFDFSQTMLEYFNVLKNRSMARAQVAIEGGL
jgi:hypothetical protein